MDHLIQDISKQEGSSERLLSLCLALQGGEMNIGTVDSSLHTQTGINIPYDDAITDTISKSLGAISIGQFTITSNGSQ